jgi:putative nucleotidyltransferase with HDIG domain
VKRILFVDDEPQVLHGLRSSLYARRKDWEMTFAGSGLAAMDLLESSPFDVLVTDLRMPGVDGLALITRARIVSPKTIRVILSGYVDDEQSRRLVSLAHRYLSKPLDPRQLEACIDRCLATQSLIQSEELRTRLGAIAELPPMPGTFAALQDALVDTGVDLRAVAGIIERDPAVTAKILQVCNSAFFRLPRRVSSIPQAVNYLGLATVRSIALCAELFKPGKALPPGLDLTLLQRHALTVGAITRVLASGRSWEEDAFLAGLLHDVGLSLLARQFPERMQRVLDAVAQGAALAAAEHEHLNIDHATAGAYLLGLWDLPFEVVDAVAAHHHGEPGAGGFDTAAAVRIAHAALAAVRPTEIPAHEPQTLDLDDALLNSLGIPFSTAALLARVEALLDPGDDE